MTNRITMMALACALMPLSPALALDLRQRTDLGNLYTQGVFEVAAFACTRRFPELDKPWAEVAFSYAGRPCTLLRLPAATLGSLEVGGAHYAAFSRVCTHLGCPVNLVRDTEVLAFSFNYRAPDPRDQHPYLGCPCHYSVFNPLASGEAVFGKAHLPLPASH